MRQEFRHNTPEQVIEYLREALAAVEELNPPEELREAVFVKACDLASGKQIMFDQPALIPDLRRH